MKDTIAKVRALISMKSRFITLLEADLRAAEHKIGRLDARIRVLEAESGWWKTQDAELGRKEAQDEVDHIEPGDAPVFNLIGTHDKD